MPDREKVIDEWETILTRDPLDAPWDLIDDTLVLLKEQEPKKIIRKQRHYEHPDGAITCYAEWHCPHCNKVVQKGFDSPWLKYCFNCGKPILWD